MRIAIAQINPTVGALAENSTKILNFAEKARELGAGLVVFPELALTGYPPEDLLLKPGFVKDNITALKDLAGRLKGISAVVGFVDRAGKQLFNASAFIEDGRVKYVYHKMILPNYGVFDEIRYFKPGAAKPKIFKTGGVPAGIAVCEDIWVKDGPVKTLKSAGAKLIIAINASPYHISKIKEREKLIRELAAKNKTYIVYCNMVGGQDEIVFDGYSLAADPNGRIIARAPGFREDLLVFDIPAGANADKKPLKPVKAEIMPVEQEVYSALVTGLGDYVSKNGFKEAVIGLSGGIDSAIVACLAADALGKERVHCVFMPSRFSSIDSRQDAEQTAKNLGIELITIPIEDIFEVYLKTLAPLFKGLNNDITEENLQARIRGSLLMALSNKFGWLVLTTGNKSEMSTGYATLYGDMAGGFAVIKDVPKTLIYRISEYRNTLGEAIPRRVITKAPTAELRADQKDSDSLPEYDILDPILKSYVEDDKSLAEITAKGFDRETVKKVFGLVDRSEYKRRQSPPGIKITPRAFGRDRRMPITNKYRGNF